jgi:hypothetical protein
MCCFQDIKQLLHFAVITNIWIIIFAWTTFNKFLRITDLYVFVSFKTPVVFRSQWLIILSKYLSKYSTIAKNAKKSKVTPTCALCGGNHPANYKGCEHYHNLIKGNTLRNNTPRTPPATTNVYEHNIHHSVNSQRQRSYVEVTKSHTNQVEDSATTLTKILVEFKGLFNQLLQQNSMVNNMLTMLINKIN